MFEVFSINELHTSVYGDATQFNLRNLIIYFLLFFKNTKRYFTFFQISETIKYLQAFLLTCNIYIFNLAVIKTNVLIIDIIKYIIINVLTILNV